MECIDEAKKSTKKLLELLIGEAENEQIKSQKKHLIDTWFSEEFRRYRTSIAKAAPEAKNRSSNLKEVDANPFLDNYMQVQQYFIQIMETTESEFRNPEFLAIVGGLKNQLDLMEYHAESIDKIFRRQY